jgi:transcriptional regulator with XRE-family HTH domain
MDSVMDRQAVAEAVNQRMRAKGMTQSALARAAGVDRTVVAKLMHADERGVLPANLGKIEAALGSPPGTIDRIGRGEPVDEHAVPTETIDLEIVLERIDSIAREVSELRALLRPRARR